MSVFILRLLYRKTYYVLKNLRFRPIVISKVHPAAIMIINQMRIVVNPWPELTPAVLIILPVVMSKICDMLSTVVTVK